MKIFVIIFWICGLLCILVQALCEVHCEYQDRTKCTRNKIVWEEGHQEKLGDNYSLTLKERGRESWMETYTIVQSKEVLARLLGSSWHKVSHRRRLMSHGNKSALISLSCSVTGWKQFMGSMASMQRQRWLSEHRSWGPLSITLPIVESLQDVFSWPLHWFTSIIYSQEFLHCDSLQGIFKCKERFIDI